MAVVHAHSRYNQVCHADAAALVARLESLTLSLDRGLTVDSARLLRSKALCLSNDDPAAAAPFFQREAEVYR